MTSDARSAASLMVAAWLCAGFGVPVDVEADPRVETNDAVVRKALEDELSRSMSELRLGDEPRPYYLAYTISDVEQLTASATFGAPTDSHHAAARVLRTDLRVGDPTFDNSNFEGSGGRFASLPIEDDYAALRRELWMRTDEAYKGALEVLARKRAAAASQASDDDDQNVGDYSTEPPAHLELPPVTGDADVDSLQRLAVRLSAVFRGFPAIAASRVVATAGLIRRRMAASDGTFVDDRQRLVRVDVSAEAQADDGMKLRSFVPFSAASVAGLPPAADMEKAVRAMATELATMRAAPVAQSGSGPVLFEGLAAGQILKLLLGDNLAGTPPPRTAAAGSEERSEQSALANKLGQKVAAPLLSAVDDPAQETGPGKQVLFGSYRIDDEGVPARRVPVLESGLLRGLLMSRTPRKEIAHSNGHARGSRFTSPRAHVGNLIVTAKGGLPRAALLAEMRKLAKGGGVTPYVVRLLEDPNVAGGSNDSDDMMALFSFGLGSNHGPPPVRPLVVYRLSPRNGKNGKDDGGETLVRGLTLENLLPRSLKDIVAAGREPAVYNFVDGGTGLGGIPSAIVAPALLFADVDIRRQTGKYQKPPLYPHPAFVSSPVPPSR
ncbi:MAG TPA: metallopeptidase TldD-related protein [Polyangia bacterium]|nr:metallopeptidase TldD-related protein [Polyangia bacterium]